MNEPWDAADEAAPRPSKSARKREHAAVQALVRRLLTLSAGQLASLPLADDAREAIAAASRLQRQAQARQLRYAAGLVAQGDVDALHAALAALERPRQQDVRAFHEVEAWRARLLDGEDTVLDEILARYPHADRAALAELVQAARQETAAGRPPRAARQLFRHLAALREPA